MGKKDAKRGNEGKGSPSQSVEIRRLETAKLVWRLKNPKYICSKQKSQLKVLTHLAKITSDIGEIF